MVENHESIVEGTTLTHSNILKNWDEMDFKKMVAGL